MEGNKYIYIVDTSQRVTKNRSFRTHLIGKALEK